MNKVEQTVYDKLSDKNVKKYKRARHTLTWRQRYTFLELSWSEDETSDMKEIKNLYQKMIIINEYMTRSAQDTL